MTELAKERITLSSLYMGNTKMEQFLVEQLRKKIEDKNFKLSMIFDSSRGFRAEGDGSTLDLVRDLKTDVLE